jgi:nitroreductase
LRPDPVPEEILRRVLRAATCAPTGGNAQPWRVIVVRDGERKRALGTHFHSTWSAYSKPGKERMAQLPPEPRARGERVMAAGDYLAEHFAEAPVVLVWVHDPNLLRHPDEVWTQPHFIYGGSLYPAIHNLLLACRAEGLGGVLTTMGWRHESEICALLEVPEPWRMHAIVPIGYPVGGGHGALARKPLASMAFGECFGQAFEG